MRLYLSLLIIPLLVVTSDALSQKSKKGDKFSGKYKSATFSGLKLRIQEIPTHLFSMGKEAIPSVV